MTAMRVFTDMNDQSKTPEQDSIPENQTVARSKQFITWLAIVIASVCLIGIGALGWYAHKLSQRIDDLRYSIAVTDYDNDNDLLAPNVGVIQFMHRGYSITFDTLTYTPSGLEVSGTLGNGTQRTLSSINLKLSAKQFLYKNRDKVINDPFFMFSSDGEIGSGQTTISYLAPGKTVIFSMTIPNVKQTQDGFEIVASFSGERYSY